MIPIGERLDTRLLHPGCQPVALLAERAAVEPAFERVESHLEVEVDLRVESAGRRTRGAPLRELPHSAGERQLAHPALPARPPLRGPADQEGHTEEQNCWHTS